ncbi:MAG: CBS domain-containing protein [Alphaproteobacteria bacterium]|nr:MAG: CBS domain-containing protein [Alphaproteobacteria bacterium]
MKNFFKKNIIIENFALLFVSIIVGIIVSGVAQVLIIAAQNFFQLLFLNPSFSLKIYLFGLKLNLIPLIICVPASILVGFLLYISKLPRWFGPADTIYAAHNKAGTLNLKGGFTSTLASLISISGGASVGIYGPLVHFGATISSFLRRLKFMPKIQHDIIIGSGVAAAISAGFGAPIAGIIFAHETVLRHFSLKAITSIALSSITANFTAYKIGIVSPPLLLNNLEFELSDTIIALFIIGPLAALVAISFMKSMIFMGSIPKKLSISLWTAPIIAGLMCGITGLFLDEVLGLGTQTVLSIITKNLDLSFLLILLIGKLFLTSCCIGLGFFGGTFSPALFLGAIVGALVYNFNFFDFELNHLSVLAVAGMASVASSVIGAPITAIILVLELTGSYEYAIASIVPISICTFLTSRVFGNSFFDKQLLSRGIDISKGREQILLNEIEIRHYASTKFTKISETMLTKDAAKLLLKNKETEGYVLSKDDILIGKIRLIDIIDKKNQLITNFLQQKPIILNSNISLLDTIKKLSSFVGESIPIIDKQSKKLIGIISENDVLAAYLEISDDINHIEKN